MKAPTVILAAVASSMISAFTIFIGPYGIYLGPGLTFGIVVLVPYCRSRHLAVGYMLVSIFSSTLGYLIAIMLYSFAGGLAPISGALGAFVTTTPLLIQQPRSALVLAYATVAGAAAGFLGGLIMEYFPSDNVSWPAKVTGTIAVWQLAVTIVMVTSTSWNTHGNGTPYSGGRTTG